MIRKQHGYTQEALAQAASVSRGTVINLERGTSTPQADVLERIWRALEDAPKGEPPAFPEAIRDQLDVIGALVMQVAPHRRAAVMADVVVVLSDAIRDQQPTSSSERLRQALG